MFTGIVEELGEVRSLRASGDSAVLTVRASLIAADVRHGASIAVNGVCLTVVGQRSVEGEPAAAGVGAAATDLDFDVMGETLARSVIGALKPGEQVNLERAARVDGRLDGHIVQGHVDGTGVVQSRVASPEWESFRFGMPLAIARYVAEKGSIAVHGVSLTVSAVGEDFFEVGLIPETLRATNLGQRPSTPSDCSGIPGWRIRRTMGLAARRTGWRTAQ
jgi:riboflavin synthase